MRNQKHYYEHTNKILMWTSDDLPTLKIKSAKFGCLIPRCFFSFVLNIFQPSKFNSM